MERLFSSIFGTHRRATRIYPITRRKQRSFPTPFLKKTGLLKYIVSRLLYAFYKLPRPKNMGNVFAAERRCICIKIVKRPTLILAATAL